MIRVGYFLFGFYFCFPLYPLALFILETNNILLFTAVLLRVITASATTFTSSWASRIAPCILPTNYPLSLFLCLFCRWAIRPFWVRPRVFRCLSWIEWGIWFRVCFRHRFIFILLNMSRGVVPWFEVCRSKRYGKALNLFLDFFSFVCTRVKLWLQQNFGWTDLC